MTDKPSIISVLSKIQKDLKAPKDKTGVGIKYKYRSCEDILEAVKLLLPEGYVVIIEDEVVQIGDRYYVKATAKLTSGEEYSLTGTAYAREPQTMASINESQVTGSTSSYARKYALNGLFAIDDTKDADALSADGVINQPNTPKTASTPSLGIRHCDKHNVDVEVKVSKTTGKTYAMHAIDGKTCFVNDPEEEAGFRDKHTDYGKDNAGFNDKYDIYGMSQDPDFHQNDDKLPTNIF